jgi:hypothetical protein
MYATFINTLVSALGFQPITRSLTHSFIQMDQTAPAIDQSASRRCKFTFEIASLGRGNPRHPGDLFLVGLRSPGDQFQVVALPRK